MDTQQHTLFTLLVLKMLVGTALVNLCGGAGFSEICHYNRKSQLLSLS